jgi:hypothetical protein
MIQAKHTVAALHAVARAVRVGEVARGTERQVLKARGDVARENAIQNALRLQAVPNATQVRRCRGQPAPDEKEVEYQSEPIEDMENTRKGRRRRE